MIVSTIATSPSVKAFCRLGLTLAPNGERLVAPALGRTRYSNGIVVNLRLRLHPFDQFIELDGLLGCGEAVGERKSVFAGGLTRLTGGSG